MPLFHRIAEQFAVSANLSSDDFVQAKADGYTAIVSNRADGESPNQLSAAEAAEVAHRLGLAFHHIPIQGGRLDEASIDALLSAQAQATGPILAYSGCGKRSAARWASAAVSSKQANTTQALEAARLAGHDITAITPLLDALQQV